MIDFNKKVYNSDKFRQPAIYFEEHGYYTSAPENTTDYFDYWKQEADRCINGYTAPDGDQITGYNYFYLNYSPIMKLVETEYTDRNGNKRTRRERLFKFPDFWDYDYHYFNAIEEAEEEGKHLVVLKARARGYSFKGASMLCRNYFLIRKSKNFAVASEQKYLTGDGLLTKAWQIMDFLDRNSGWAKRRLKSTALERTSGFKVKDEITGKETEDGYQSSIMGITLKNDPERIRGTRGRLVLWEEAGKFPDIKQAWQIERPAIETDDGKAFGLMICFGTGGEEGADFEGLQDMFYHPDGFNCLEFPNIWDDGQNDQKCGFFVPAWSNLQSDEHPECMDKDGNTNKPAAVKVLIEQRERVRNGQPDETVVDRYVAEHPITPQEAILEVGTNIFPKKQLQMQLSHIRTNKKLASMKHIVDLAWDGNGQVKAIEKKEGDITHYPLKSGEKPDGAVVIWEYPINDPPFGLYIAGCLLPGEKVYTQRGLVNVENVTLRDQLVSKDGELVHIKNLQRYLKNDEDVFEIKPARTFRTTTFTSQHPIYVKGKGFVKAENLRGDETLIIPNRYRYTDPRWSDFVFDGNTSLAFAYFLGCFLGDGFTYKDGNSYNIYVSIGKNETKFASCYDELIKQLFDRTCVHKHKNNEQTRSFTNKKLFLWLNKNFGKYADGKHIPKWLMYAPVEIKRQFLQGYLDTDGSVILDGGNIRINYTSVNLELLEQVQDMLFSLKIPCSIVLHDRQKDVVINGRVTHCKESYRINIAASGVNDLMSEGGWMFYESRKYKKWFDNRYKKQPKAPKNIKFVGDKIELKIQSIRKGRYSGWVYNFECNTHTFMCRNIVTHNCDPFDHDASQTNSLGSTFIFKRFKAGEAWTDVLVAEYSGRPQTADEYYENVRKLLTMYNARLLFENERKGIYPYFTNKHCDYLLADQPDKVIGEIFKDSKVQRRKGCHMTVQIRQYAEGLIKEWLLEEYAPGHPNLERIYSEPLIEELLLDDGVRNVDRVIALCMVMMYREELYQVKIAETKKENKQVEFFEQPLFNAQYWDDNPAESTDFGIQTFTF